MDLIGSTSMNLIGASCPCVRARVQTGSIDGRADILGGRSLLSKVRRTHARFAIHPPPTRRVLTTAWMLGRRREAPRAFSYVRNSKDVQGRTDQASQRERVHRSDVLFACLLGFQVTAKNAAGGKCFRSLCFSGAACSLGRAQRTASTQECAAYVFF
eukprot:2511170-Pleurochrysis_carterae.AAC.2